MSIIARALRYMTVGLGLAVLGACTTTSSPDRMSIGPGVGAAATAGSHSDHNLRVGRVSGGGNANGIGLADVTDDVLSAALSASLGNLGYLAAVPDKAGYVVNADIADVDRPAAAFDPALLVVPIDMTVTVKIHYVVRSAQGGAAVFDDTVATTGTGEAASALTPYGRVKKANEAAVRLNIADFLRRLQSDWK